jgi:hypothetical protein
MDNKEQRVFDLVSRKTGLPISSLSLQQRLLQDLGVDGDDAAELLSELANDHKIDLRNLDFGKHFRPEPHMLTVFRLPSTTKRELAEKIPVTIADLVLAVRTGSWVVFENRD